MLSILGGAPLYFEPTESASLWRMLDRILDSREIWEDVAQRGYQQARRYSWERTAYTTFRLYEKLCGREAAKSAGQ
jgi:glycogen synthase